MGHTHVYTALFKFSDYWPRKYFLIIVYLHFFFPVSHFAVCLCLCFSSLIRLIHGLSTLLSFLKEPAFRFIY